LNRKYLCYRKAEYADRPCDTPGTDQKMVKLWWYLNITPVFAFD